MTIGSEILLIFLLALLNGVLAMAEIALVSARKVRLRQRAEAGDRGARAALELTQSPGRFLSTVQIGITLVGIFAGAFGGATLAEELAVYIARLPALAPYSDALGLGLVVLGITYLSLILGELVPKQLALFAPERIASFLARPVAVLAKVSAPAVFLLDGSSRLLLRLFGARPSTDSPVTEEELKYLLEQGTLAGVFEPGEDEIVARVIQLGHLRVGDFATPRYLVTALDADAPLAENLAKVAGNDHFYFPVFEGALDRTLGVVSVKDLWRSAHSGEELDLRKHLTQPVYVPEGVSALRALERLRETGSHIALVIDEYGGLEGVVTLNDLLRAIVGDLPTAAAREKPPLAVPREDGSWLLDGMLAVAEVCRLLGLSPAAAEELDELRTLGGFVMAQLGRVPAEGDRFEWEGWRFELVDMDQRRVDKVLAVRIPPPATPVRPVAGES